MLWIDLVDILKAIRIGVRDAIRDNLRLAVKAIQTGYSPFQVWECTARSLFETPPAQQSATFQHFLNAKQRELEIVVVSSVLVATLVGSLMSWSWFPAPPYTTKVAMLCALVHSLLGTSIATQQFLLLGRISISQKRDAVLLTAIFGSDPGPLTPKPPRARRLASFAWHSPIMLLGNSIVFLLVGITIQVYDAARRAGVWGADVVTAICFTISLVFAVATYSIHWVTLHWLVDAQLET